MNSGLDRYESVTLNFVPWVLMVLSLAIASGTDLHPRHRANIIYYLVGWETSTLLGSKIEIQWSISLLPAMLHPKMYKCEGDLLRLPLFLGLRSTQSPIKAPSRSTDPATTNPNTAVNSRLRPYSSIRNTEIAKCHMRSPCLTHNKTLSLYVPLKEAVYIVSHSL